MHMPKQAQVKVGRDAAVPVDGQWRDNQEVRIGTICMWIVGVLVVLLVIGGLIFYISHLRWDSTPTNVVAINPQPAAPATQAAPAREKETILLQPIIINQPSLPSRVKIDGTLNANVQVQPEASQREVIQ